MILIRSRLGFVIACLAVALFCWAVVFLPPYEKIVYEKSPVLSKEEADERYTRAIGYKGAENIQRVYCIDDLRNEKGIINVVLEINSENLEETGIYQCIEEYRLTGEEKSAIKVFFLRTIKSYGQYYIATLESGEKIPVFIDDSLVNVRKKGIIQLPIGSIDATTINFEEYEVNSLFNNRYLDCATGFATGREMQDFRFMEKIAVVVIVVVMAIILVIVLGMNMGKSMK